MFTIHVYTAFDTQIILKLINSEEDIISLLILFTYLVTLKSIRFEDWNKQTIKIETTTIPCRFSGHNWLWLQILRQEHRKLGRMPGHCGRKGQIKKKFWDNHCGVEIFIYNFEQVGGRAECANEGNYGNENGNSTREAHRGFVHGLNLQMTRWRGEGTRQLHIMSIRW